MGEKHRQLIDSTAADFLKAVYNGRPDDISALSDSIGIIADIMSISQIYVIGTKPIAAEMTVYKRYDTKMLNKPDWECVVSAHEPQDTTVQFWKDNDAEWDETDAINMENLSMFIILCIGRVWYIREARNASEHDAVTGLVNLAGLTKAIQSLYDQEVAHRYSLLYMSAYKFQLINQKYGYEAGTQVMQQVSRKLQAFAAVLPGEQVVARLVNDNLVVIVHNSSLQSFLDYLSELEVVFTFNQEMITQKISFNVGIYGMKKEDKNVQLPMEYAVAAYTISCQGGRSKMVYYNEEIHNQFLREKDIEARMADALKDGEFVVYFQPKIELSTNRLIGAEALVRWCTNGQVIPPGEFIPIFERNGFVCQIDFFVLEFVCRSIRRWLDEGLDVVKTSVNFSRMHLLNEDFTSKIIAIMKRYRIPARYMEIEFTESADADDSMMLFDALEELKNYGIATAMDDFGTGYSSLSLLTNLSFDILKIDKSLLDAENVSERERVVMNNIVHMVQDLDIDVIMEGVETVEQVEFLKEIHCNMAQGFLFDRPLPIDKFEERLKTGSYEEIFK